MLKHGRLLIYLKTTSSHNEVGTLKQVNLHIFQVMLQSILQTFCKEIWALKTESFRSRVNLAF